MKPLKKLERYFTAIFKLGRTEWMAKQALRQTQAQEARIAEVLGQVEDRSHHQRDQIAEQLAQASAAQNADQKAAEAAYKSGLAVLSRSISDLTQRLDRLMLGPSDPAPAPPKTAQDLPDLEGLAAFKDQFYHRLENQYRGSRAEITKRLRIYLTDITRAVKATGGKPILDLGCGRGEWLETLKGAGITAYGIDTNPVQIAEARELGLDVRLEDAVHTLSQAEDASLAVITAHHLIEHLPFDLVAWITREAQRVLAPGGLLLFETPNTRNVLVGATTFHTDPTHLKPMPEQVMGVLFETAGFDPVELRHLNPHERLDEFLAKPDMNDELAFLLFGPQDLTILGHKPLAQG